MSKLVKAKKELLTKRSKEIWSDWMTPEFVFEENGIEYVWMKDDGFDKMEHVYRIISIKEAMERIKEESK